MIVKARPRESFGACARSGQPMGALKLIGPLHDGRPGAHHELRSGELAATGADTQQVTQIMRATVEYDLEVLS